jgi:hypothetical protein
MEIPVRGKDQMKKYTKISRDLRKSRICQALVAVIIGVLSASSAHASVISGPALTQNDSGWVYSGVGFTATVSSILTSFTFQNQGAADTVILVDPLGNILHSVGTPASTPSDTVSVSWALTAGLQYYLLQSTVSNSKYAFWELAAPSDAEIALTDTGDFSSVVNSSGFGIGGGAGSGTVFWAAFNNITTNGTGSSVPEPASFGLVLLAAVAIVWRARREGLIR